VDLFFRTLAETYGADAVGVVLSGTGGDGTAGIRYIREAGGITVAQSPEESEYDGMPASAIATGLIDLVLPSAQIPGQLIRLRHLPSPLAAADASHWKPGWRKSSLSCAVAPATISVTTSARRYCAGWIGGCGSTE